MCQWKLMTAGKCDELRMAWVVTYLLPVIATRRFPPRLRTSDNGNRVTDSWRTIVTKTSNGSVNERFLREATGIEIWWSTLVDGKEPVCPFARTFVMIVGALVTWAIYTQGKLLV